jgi:RNA polymerase sigma-70 factor (sigma-E family)
MSNDALIRPAVDSVRLSSDFAAVYRDHALPLLRFAYLLCGHQQQAEDAVAETFAKVLPQWQRGRLTQPGAYLRRTLVNEVTSRGRRRVLEIREERRRSAAGRGLGDIGDHAADRDALMHALRQLPVGQRAVLVLRYYEDLPESDVAAVLGMSVGTVKSQAARGIARLRHLMEER